MSDTCTSVKERYEKPVAVPLGALVPITTASLDCGPPGFYVNWPTKPDCHAGSDPRGCDNGGRA